MLSLLSLRLMALFGGVLSGLGLDQVEGPDAVPGYLVLGLGVGLMAAALVRPDAGHREDHDRE